MHEPADRPVAGSDDAEVTRPGGPAFAGPPRWVVVTGIVVVDAVVLLVALQFLGGGEHGPGRHDPAGGVGSRGSAGVTEAAAPRGLAASAPTHTR